MILTSDHLESERLRREAQLHLEEAAALYREAERLGNTPEAPDGWHYGVVMGDGRVWGCGEGSDGRARQRMRLRYADVTAACFIAPPDDNAKGSRR